MGWKSKTAWRCHHCKEVIAANVEHDCWTTTEEALTADLSDDLRDAWERLRETAAAFGDQRIYASGTAIMFSRESCYFFVRPRRSFLQVCIFLGRAIRAPQVRRVEKKSAAKTVNIVHVRHRDEVEPPITEWLEEAYAFNVRAARSASKHRGGRAGRAGGGSARSATRPARPRK